MELFRVKLCYFGESHTIYTYALTETEALNNAFTRVAKLLKINRRKLILHLYDKDGRISVRKENNNERCNSSRNSKTSK